MSYITSKKTFPVAMIGFPLTEKAIKDRRSVMFVYGEGDETFRVRANEFEYQEIMRDLKLAHEGVSLTLCGSASISGTDLSRSSSTDSFVLCIRCLDGLPDLACGFWSRRGWTAIGPSWRSRRGSAFAQAAVGVQPIGTACMSVNFKTCRRKERA